MKLERIGFPRNWGAHLWLAAERVSLPLVSLLLGVGALGEFAFGDHFGLALAALCASAFWGGVAVLARRRRLQG